jgi:hypothetical protein
MNNELELEHVERGPALGERPFGVGITSIIGDCSGNASQVANRAKYIMRPLQKSLSVL